MPWTSRNPRDITVLFGEGWERYVARVRETRFFTRVCPHGRRAPVLPDERPLAWAPGSGAEPGSRGRPRAPGPRRRRRLRDAEAVASEARALGRPSGRIVELGTPLPPDGG